MKKIFFVLAAFVLLITPVYSQSLTFGGTIYANADLARGDVSDPERLQSSTRFHFSVMAAVENGDDTAGAKGQFVPNLDHEKAGFWAYAWWKPIEYFMIKGGSIHEDNTWAGADITGAGFHANDYITRIQYGHDSLNLDDNYAGNVLKSSQGFFDFNFNKHEAGRLQLSFYPIPGLAINFGFPMLLNERNSYEVKDNYIDHLHAQAVYEIDGIGEVALSFINAPEVGLEQDVIQNFFAQWKMPLGDNMKIEAGFNYTQAGRRASGPYWPDSPIGVGLGWSLGNIEDNDPLTLNVRAGASIPMSDGDTTDLGVDVILSYDLDKFGRLYVPVGVGMILPAETAPASVETLLAWKFSPYLIKSLSAGGPSVYGGISLYNGDANGARITAPAKDNINITIPIGLRWDF